MDVTDRRTDTGRRLVPRVYVADPKKIDRMVPLPFRLGDMFDRNVIVDNLV